MNLGAPIFTELLSTGTTKTASVFGSIYVCFCVLMAVRTVCSACVLGYDSVSKKQILSVFNYSQVIEIDASLVPTTMVYLKSFWDWFYKGLVGESVGINKSSLPFVLVGEKYSVTCSSFGGYPIPTSGTFIDAEFFNKSLENWSTLAHEAEIIS